MTKQIVHAAKLLLLVNLLLGIMGEELTPTVSPSTDFIAMPRNITVLEGHPAVLRCKMRETVHNCQWLYLETGLDLFESHSKAVLVKEFRPTKERDCSIKFSKTRVVQSGQWICKGIQIQARKYIVSRPAFLTVISTYDIIPNTTTTIPTDTMDKENETPNGIKFEISEEGQIINTNLGYSEMIGCKVINKELRSCSWMRPDGSMLLLEQGTNDMYTVRGSLTEGNCSLLIKEVSSTDEGDWRCVVSTSSSATKNLGPLIHLHVLDLGIHAQDDSRFLKETTDGVSLIGVLVATSVALIAVIVVLICYMYKRIWQKNSPSHKYLESCRSGNSDYTAYGSTWQPQGESTPSKSMDDNTDIRLSRETNSSHGNQYTRYLDMTGNSKADGYIMFPSSSVRSSMSSRTTISTFPVGHNAVFDADHSPRTSTNESLHSSSTLGRESLNMRPPVNREDSVESEGHLYEEIDETMRRRKDNADLPDYANIEEDHEGYMIPRSSSTFAVIPQQDEITSTDENPSTEPTKASPYSKVGQTSLIPDPEASTDTSNPTYSDEHYQHETNNESYNSPSEPPVPIRDDSIDNPLAEYDVPKQISEETLPVFV